MLEKKFSKEEVDVKMRAYLTANEKEAGANRSGALSDDDLDTVTGGVGAWAFNYNGVVATGICSKGEITNGEFEYYLCMGMSCPYGPRGKSCYECPNFTIWQTDRRVN